MLPGSPAAPRPDKGAAARQRIADLARWLPDPDGALIRAAYADGRPLGELAAVLGTNPRILERRLRRIARRVLAPEFALVVAQRVLLDRRTGGVAGLCIIDGLSVRACARRLGLSVYTVRRRRQDLRAMAKGLR